MLAKIETHLQNRRFNARKMQSAPGHDDLPIVDAACLDPRNQISIATDDDVFCDRRRLSRLGLEVKIDRKNVRQHLSFGWGVHFCLGSRLAEMQLRILWEEVMDCYREVEVVGEPIRVRSCFVKGFEKLPVRVPPW